MPEEERDAECLYRRVLGDTFADLPPVLRRFHGLPAGGTADGTLCVERAPGRLRGWLADRLRLPQAGENVPVVLETAPACDGEAWRRSFGGRLTVTRQWRRGDLLVEAAGPLRFGLQVMADARGMHMRTSRCWLWGLPLPFACAPRVAADVIGNGCSWSLDVTVEAPVLGRLARYSGEVTPRW